MRDFKKHIELVLPTLLLFTIILVIPQLNNSNLMLPTQSGKAFGFLWGMLGYVVVVIFIATIDKEAHTIKITPIDLFLGAYCLMIGISYWLHPTDKLEMLSFGALILFYLSVRAIHKNYLRLLLLAVVISGTIQAIYGNLQLWGYYPSNHSIFRMTGSFFNPGPYAGYLCTILPIAVGLYFGRVKKVSIVKNIIDTIKIPNNKNISNSKVFNPSTLLNGIALISIISIALVLPASRSRATWLGAIVGCFYIFQTFKPFSNIQTFFQTSKPSNDVDSNLSYPSNSETIKRRSLKPFRHYKQALIIAGILISLVLLVGLYKFKQASADGRLLIWKVSTKMIKDKPIFGHGTDKFAADYMNYQAAYFKSDPNVPESMNADNVIYAYNEYIKLTVEHGLMGLLMVIGIILCFFFGKTESGHDKNPSLMVTRGGLLAILVFALFSYPSEILPIKMLFVLFAAVVAAHQQSLQLFQLPDKKTAFTSKAIGYTAPVLALLTIYPASKYLIQQYQTYKSWKDASDLYYVGAYPECLEDFELAYPQLKTNGQFLVQYGKALEMAEKYENSITIMNEAKKHLNNTILYTCLGNNYKALSKNTEAEQAYLQAWYMAPTKFFPLYLLAKLYDETGQQEKAVAMAKKVMVKEVKIESTAIKEIIEEMQQILTKHASLQISNKS